MRSFFYVLTALAVMALAFWAYRENYTTQSRVTDIQRLQSEIGDLQESLSVLKAEWAYLNRPDRLRELADINFDRLQLLPLQPTQFAAPAQIIYPPRELPPVTDPVETSAQVAEGGAVPAASPAAQAGAAVPAVDAAKPAAPKPAAPKAEVRRVAQGATAASPRPAPRSQRQNAPAARETQP